MADLPPATARTPYGLTDEQRALRRLGIGGSDIPAICGLAAKRGPRTVWEDKVNGYQQPATEEMDFGHRFEDMATRWFSDITRLGVVNQQRSAVHPTEPWAMATLDGEVVEWTELPPDPAWHLSTPRMALSAPLGVLEIKSFNVVEDGDVKGDVLAQVLWQLYVTGLPTAWVFGLVGHAPQVKVVHAADHVEDIDWIVAQARTFWFDHVLPQIPPTPTRADLPMLEGTPVTETKAVEVTTDIADAWARRQAIKAQMKALGDTADDLEAIVRAAIGDAELATYAGVPVLSATTTTRTTPDMAAITERWPEAAALVKRTTFRTLRNPRRRR